MKMRVRSRLRRSHVPFFHVRQADLNLAPIQIQSGLNPTQSKLIQPTPAYGQKKIMKKRRPRHDRP
jgi:hypothetical protein